MTNKTISFTVTIDYSIDDQVPVICEQTMEDHLYDAIENERINGALSTCDISATNLKVKFFKASLTNNLIPISAKIGDFTNGEYPIIINDTLINQDIFDNDAVDYQLTTRESIMDNLFSWIGELTNSFSKTRSSDLELMKNDLKNLQEWDDEYIFSSTLSNEYISPSRDTKEFNEICNGILKLNK